MKNPPKHAGPRGPPLAWEALLRQAITTPGLMHDAYTRFHQYSLRNQLLAMSQCIARGLTPGPLATYKEWERLGRHVLRGQKALVLCMPFARSRQEKDDDAEDTVEDASARVLFMYRARWFVLCQTDGDAYATVVAPTWSEERALQVLGIHRVPFVHLDGNVQGYATGHREVAISPVVWRQLLFPVGDNYYSLSATITPRLSPALSFAGLRSTAAAARCAVSRA